MGFLEAGVVRRAAFEFGSGSIRVQVADVDTETGAILRTVHSESALVRLSDDLITQSDKKFSKEIQDTAINIAKKLKERAIELNAKEFQGIATEAYRVASNGELLTGRYSEELGVPVTVISQEEEGRLGFLALVSEYNLDPFKILCWDTGGGSLQISYMEENGEMKVYKAPLGISTTKSAVRHIKKEASTLNPLSQEESQLAFEHLKSLLPGAPKELLEKLKQKDAKLIAICAHPATLKSLGTYTLEDVEKAIINSLDKTDEDLILENQKPFDSTQLLLVKAIMQTIDADEVTYLSTSNGSTQSLLTLKDYWYTQIN